MENLMSTGTWCAFAKHNLKSTQDDKSSSRLVVLECLKVTFYCYSTATGHALSKQHFHLKNYSLFCCNFCNFRYLERGTC